MERNIRILGIDYGLKRIGLAAGDSGEKLAVPLMVLNNRGLDAAVNEIADICRKEEIGAVIVGLPMGMGGREGGQADLTRDFISRLEEAIDIPVKTEDERLTTAAAERVSLGQKARDHVAAMFILQSYFDRTSSNEK